MYTLIERKNFHIKTQHVRNTVTQLYMYEYTSSTEIRQHDGKHHFMYAAPQEINVSNRQLISALYTKHDNRNSHMSSRRRVSSLLST